MTDRRQLTTTMQQLSSCKCNLQEASLQGLWIGLTKGEIEK